MAKQEFHLDFCGRGITVETGEIAKQADGAVIIRYGDTVTLSTACASNQAKEGIDFFPLTVSFEEKLYSVGKIPGGFLRREGRPSEHATLTARMIDRPIRPLFAEGFRNEVQVVNTVLSVDQDASPEMAAMFGASLALCISDIPFNGPIAGVKVGRINGELVANPTVAQMEESDIDLTVAGTAQALNMVEAGAKEVSEEDMLAALMFGHEQIKKLCAFQEEIVAACGKEKREIELYAVDETIDSEVRKNFEAQIRAAVSIKEKLERYGKIDDLTDEAAEMIANKEYESEKDQNNAVKQAREICRGIEADEVRRLIIEDKVRPDGRQIDEIRPLNSQVDLLPRVHGSALFTRGETQVLSTTTLGALNDNQIIDDLTVVDSKRFMHHYNFPPYCVGETGRMGNPGRREIGHGALGERALAQVLPSVDEFPYTIRTVADVMESNGSSSQASICASTMSLMAAGVPIKKPVAGISCGLVTGDTDDEYLVLTDIQGLEDFFGDMDFKVAGTKDGITAIQMDIKIHGLTRPIVEEAIRRTREARMYILNEVMLPAIGAPREKVGTYAPKIVQIQIDPQKIGDVVGQRGKTINTLIERTGVKIDITDDGSVSVCGEDEAMMQEAIRLIQIITTDYYEGQILEGDVVSIKEFGAFVEFAPGKEGMVHISKIANERINHVEDVLTLGDHVKVVCLGKDKMGRTSFSIKDVKDQL